MRLFQNVLSTNFSFVHFANMRGSLLPISLTSLFSLSAHASSYHNNAGTLQFVNPKIGTYGITPSGNGTNFVSSGPPRHDSNKPSNLRVVGGMIPSTGMPFGMTRWTPQTRENFISQCPYNDADQYIHGFQATHQPAIWMGESGQMVLSPGVGDVAPLFTQRAHRFSKANELSMCYIYQVTMDADAVAAGHNLTESIYSPVPGGEQPVPAIVSEGANGRTRRAVPVGAEATSVPGSNVRNRCESRKRSSARISVDMTATGHVGLMQVTFANTNETPYVFLQATRQNWTGTVNIDSANREISGSNPQRQDYALGPFHALNFQGYFVSRFSESFHSYGIAKGADLEEGVASGEGEHLGAYAAFGKDVRRVEIRTGVSFVSVEQARRNLDIEGPESITFADAVENLKSAWL